MTFGLIEVSLPRISICINSRERRNQFPRTLRVVSVRIIVRTCERVLDFV